MYLEIHSFFSPARHRAKARARADGAESVECAAHGAGDSIGHDGGVGRLSECHGVVMPFGGQRSCRRVSCPSSRAGYKVGKDSGSDCRSSDAGGSFSVARCAYSRFFHIVCSFGRKGRNVFDFRQARRALCPGGGRGKMVWQSGGRYPFLCLLFASCRSGITPCCVRVVCRHGRCGDTFVRCIVYGEFCPRGTLPSRPGFSRFSRHRTPKYRKKRIIKQSVFVFHRMVAIFFHRVHLPAIRRGFFLHRLFAGVLRMLHRLFACVSQAFRRRFAGISFVFIGVPSARARKPAWICTVPLSAFFCLKMTPFL